MPPRELKYGAAVSLAVALLLAAQQSRGQSLPIVPPLESSPSANGDLSRSAGSRYAPTGAPGDDFAVGDPTAGSPVSANYGAPRPRKKLPKPYPPPRVHAGAPQPSKNPLPPLAPYKTSAVARRASRLGLRREEPPPEAGPTVAALPTIKAKPRPKVEPEPYDPVGIGLGSLRLSPFLETTTGYDSNPDRFSSSASPAPTGSRLVRGDAGFKLRSDWSRDELQADLRLGYVDYLDYEKASRPDGVGNLTARYDVTRDTAIDVLGHFNLDTQRPGAPAISSGLPNVTVTNRPVIFSAGTAVGVTEKLNRLEVSMRGSFDRTIYEDAHYSDGSTFNLSSTDFNDYGVTGRVAYEVSPTIKPFAEGTYDTRVHDSQLDPYGYERDSDGVALRGGAEVKISELLKGQASGGYAERTYKDPRLPRLKGPTADASLVYTPTPLTTVTLRGSTSLNETTLPGSSGSLARTINLELAHNIFRNLTVSANGGYFNNEYPGVTLREYGYTAGAKLEYKITRSIAIRASYSHERLSSNTSGDDYTANVYLVGLKFQQ